jgi:Cu/Ag efflux pump CusA
LKQTYNQPQKVSAEKVVKGFIVYLQELLKVLYLPSKFRKLKIGLNTADLGKGVTIGYDGFDKYNQEAANYLVLGFIAMLFVMLIVLVAQFNSFYQANIVLSAILLSFGGVFVSLLILDRSFSTVTNRYQLCGSGRYRGEQQYRFN